MEDDAFVTCLRCGNRNSNHVSHCYYCGDRLERICSHCGHDNSPEAKYYCENCEQPLVAATGEPTPESARTSKPTPESAETSEPTPELSTTSEPTPVSSETAPTIAVGVCPRCNHSNQRGSSFCSNCGLCLDDGRAHGAPTTIGAFKLGTPGGFWVRVGAAIIDYFVVSTLNVIVAIYNSVGILEFYGAGFGYQLDSESPSNPLEQFNLINWTLVAVNWVFYIVYAPLLISLWGTTVGKRPFDLYVVKADGGRCSFWRALGREFAKFISCGVFFVGYLMIAFREDKRGLHDLIAGTAVIKKSD